ncbi:hypothetical protein O181_001868 [Austropuccinia psidii MF-1]|uniref:Uncharacterized protein n=1 Tax=Austropuccinia psidii MF-1 TaxID=1389203 RepID=A0A9Q3BBC5_9BASI|nr:hypothetical protein [Austropuccinia psidii MF-1]
MLVNVHRHSLNIKILSSNSGRFEVFNPSEVLILRKSRAPWNRNRIYDHQSFGKVSKLVVIQIPFSVCIKTSKASINDLFI